MGAEIASAVVRRADGSVGARIDAIVRHGGTAVPEGEDRNEDGAVVANESTAYQVRVYSDDSAVPDVLLDPHDSYEDACAAAEAAVAGK